MCIEDPISHSLWLAKALPRVWLSDGESLSLEGMPTAYGRLSLSIHSSVASHSAISANLTLPPSWAVHASERPAGGVRLRLRPPDAGLRIRSVTLGVGQQPWGSFNDSTIAFESDELPPIMASLQCIWVLFA